MKVYTKSGDDGTTSLFSGGRVTKDHDRIEAYGTIDELNSILGALLCEPLSEGVVKRLRAVQDSLFSVGGALADPEEAMAQDEASWRPAVLEEWIDEMEEDLPPLKSFILPGGSRPAAMAHMARTVCRRAERRVMVVSRSDIGVGEGILPFLNRLSDVLFVLARYINARMGIADPQWKAKQPS
ncbi:MAG: cob(I)yrinic acid a,c-diamide adenosyltransferase [Thermoanaerobaculales bacterium]|nr:cob(I)yrinic acid a,c-diamide adenosyltransferase [Thermoanaerobaculales bacterium]